MRGAATLELRYARYTESHTSSDACVYLPFGLLKGLEAGGAVGTGIGTGLGGRLTVRHRASPLTTFAQVPYTSARMNPFTPPPLAGDQGTGQDASQVIAAAASALQHQHASSDDHAHAPTHDDGEVGSMAALDHSAAQQQPRAGRGSSGRGGRRSSLVLLLGGNSSEQLTMPDGVSSMLKASNHSRVDGMAGSGGPGHHTTSRGGPSPQPPAPRGVSSVYARAMAETAQKVAAAVLASFDAPHGALQAADPVPTPSLLQRNDGGKWGGKDFSRAGRGGDHAAGSDAASDVVMAVGGAYMYSS